MKDFFEPNPGSSEAKKLTISPITKFLLEVGPIAIFYLINMKGQILLDHFAIFAIFKQPIFLATFCFIIATIVALISSLYLMRRIPVLPCVSAILVVVFGSLTLWFHNDNFIKIKPTAINLLLAALLLGGLLFKRSLIAYVFDEFFSLDEKAWKILTWRLIVFYLIQAVLNEIIWRNFSTNFWVNFKLFVVSILNILFWASQVPFIQKHHIKSQKNNPDKQ